ncbi:hypothetical protein CL1_1951 [Thermococcus cleftensis]|uniref:Uncharacterized protein n=1 Tax=Thermococcus cleftensis (strain DSM 27260 / KACC 17922 / CL1) TaxID=163003 RepID=I3ZWR2_THECF|nr:hypothetical protein [Thermococcus cleftensis]AFL96146.1 hypothetical protein CL1_1951 [Thermococcus cleftensis]
MKSWELRRKVGFLVLALTSWAFLAQTDIENATFATTVAFILLLFAWTDYFSFVIYIAPAFGAIAGLFAGNFDGIYYGIPTGLAFVLFALLMSRNREKLATLVFLLTLPLAVVNAHLYPVSSAIVWTFIGLMVGLIENAVIEEMAGGDVLIIALYFMALGPLAFIPTALQTFTGRALFEKVFDDVSAYPVGPAMFVIALPLFLATPGLVENHYLPEWLFYAHFHGLQSPGWAFFVGLGAMFLSGYATSLGDDDPIAAIMGLTAGLVVGMVVLVGLVLLGMYVEGLGHEGLSTLLALGALALSLFAWLFSAVSLAPLHYEGKSSIPPHLWFWGLNAVALLLSVPLLPKLWRPGEGTFITALLVALFFLVALGEERKELGPLWTGLLALMALLAGLWTGLGVQSVLG